MKQTRINENGCPISCPCIDNYPNCYCMNIINEDKETQIDNEELK